MKQSQQCPKCRGQKFWVIDPFRATDPALSNAAAPVAAYTRTGILGIDSVEPRGHFQLWTCAACGYSELWADGLSTLRPDAEAGVELVDHSVAPKGPFR